MATVEIDEDRPVLNGFNDVAKMRTVGDSLGEKEVCWPPQSNG
jgi:hypothetical protein